MFQVYCSFSLWLCVSGAVCIYVCVYLYVYNLSLYVFCLFICSFIQMYGCTVSIHPFISSLHDVCMCCYYGDSLNRQPLCMRWIGGHMRHLSLCWWRLHHPMAACSPTCSLINIPWPHQKTVRTMSCLERKAAKLKPIQAKLFKVHFFWLYASVRGMHKMHGLNQTNPLDCCPVLLDSSQVQCSEYSHSMNTEMREEEFWKYIQCFRSSLKV